MTTLLLAALLAQGDARPSPTATAKPAVVVHMKNFAFVPATVQIKPGEGVQWVNDDGDAHTVDSDTKLFSSGGLDTNERWTHVFKDAGSFTYFCALHPFMKGVVIVKP